MIHIAAACALVCGRNQSDATTGKLHLMCKGGTTT
jgi:hypothetical protein